MSITKTNIDFLIKSLHFDLVSVILVFCLSLYSNSLYSQEKTPPPLLNYTIQNAPSIQELPPLRWVIQEGEMPLSIEDVLLSDFKDAKINTITSETIIAPLGKYWFAISMDAEFPVNNWLLFLKEKWYRAKFIKGYPDVSLYFTKGGKLIKKGKTGSEIPASQRDITSHATMSLANINYKSGDHFLIWVALSNNELERPIPELYLYDSTINFPAFEKESYITFGLSIGITTLLFIISFFLWFLTKEHVYGWFVCILILMGFTELLAADEEWLVVWLFPEQGYLRFRVAMLLALALRVFLLQFGRVFINLPKKHPKLNILFKRLIWVTVIGLGSIGLFFPRGDALSLNVWGVWTVLLVIYSLVMCGICIRLLFLPNWLAKIYGIGTGLFFSTPILGPLFQNLGIAQVFFNPESLAPIGMTLTMLFGLIYRFWDIEQQKSKQLQRISIASNKFVPTTFLNFLGKSNILDATLGDYVEKQVTVMFSDIRDYTSLSEKMTPKQNFKFVNAFNQRMGPIIQQNKGFINQYLGDGMMAIFPERAEDPLKAAISMQQNLIAYNPSRINKGRVPIKMGIGLHAGPLIMGIIGYDERMDAAIISDTVNAASRLENLTKHFGVSILVSDTVVNRLVNKEAYNLRYLGLVQVKGKQEAIKIYECFDGDELATKEKKAISKEKFNQGINAYYAKKFEQADELLRYVLAQNPSDHTAQLFYNKNKISMKEGIPENWTGIEVIHSN